MDNIDYLKPSLQRRQKRRDKRLGEELIECYRRGWRTKRMKGYISKIERNDYANAQHREGIKAMHGGGTRYFNDNLEPLTRFLNTHQGKNWDKLYKELCTQLDKRTLPGLHAFNHLWDFVILKVRIENKKIYYLRFGRFEELLSREKWPKFYIHPKTGQLCKARQAE